MKYVTLKPQYALRGYKNVDRAILDIKAHSHVNKYFPITQKQLEYIQFITSGSISIEDNLIPDKIRNMAYKALEKGFFEECGKETSLADYQKYHKTEAKFVHTLLWSLTGNCNLKCKHCYISSGDNCYGEPDFGKCKDTVEQMLDANVNMVALTGGEPLVRKDFWKIVDMLLDKHISILQIFSNGVLINDNFIDEFEIRNIDPNYFLISFDGIGCHDWLRGVRGAEEKAIKAIKLLKSRGYSVVVTTSLHMGNISSLLPTYKLMKDIGVDFWKAVPIIDTGNWRNQPDNRINLAKIYSEYLLLLKEYKKDNAPMELGLGGFFRCEKNSLDKWRCPAVSGCGTEDRCSESLCEMVRIFPYLLPDGRVLPCIAMSGTEMENIAPNIYENNMSLEKALGQSEIETYCNKTYKDLFDNNQECSECKNKLICSGCRANALTADGFYGKDMSACFINMGGYKEKISEIMNVR